MDGNIITIIIAQIFGIISWILLLYSYTKKDINKLLFIQILVCIFDILSYFLLGADAGLLICIVELVKNILYYKTDKDDLIFKISIFVYLLIGLLTIKEWYASLPVIACILDSFGTSKNSKIANICSIISNSLWAVYDILILSYIGAINDIVVVICNISILLFGYSKLLNISNFRIIKNNRLNKNTLDNIYKLDYKNFGKENTWEKNYQMDVYKRNKDSFFYIKYDNRFSGYINYLNIIEEEYNYLKSLNKMPSKINLDNIIKFKKNKKAFILIETINIKKEYENSQTIDLICKKLINFIKTKYKQRIFINGIISFTVSDFEENIYKSLKFTKIKELDNNIKLYEITKENIKKYYLAK
ncbi:MAG: YgjV family protein [Bacilli bacterium]|nr:YgjV family protein [Bacilli bacterium]